MPTGGGDGEIGAGDRPGRPRAADAAAREAFGQVFGFWLKDPPRGECAFAKGPGQPPASSQAARTDRRGMLRKARIDKRISPHKLRHTDATNLLDAGAERVDLQALLGHEDVATTSIDTHVGQERMEQVVARLWKLGRRERNQGKTGVYPRFPALATHRPTLWRMMLSAGKLSSRARPFPCVVSRPVCAILHMPGVPSGTPNASVSGPFAFIWKPIDLK